MSNFATASDDAKLNSNTIVIGAGPAGLAVTDCLQQAGLSAMILEQAPTVASAWHNHYDRLHLHTSKSLSALPFAPFPRAMPRYPSRLQVIEYLDGYASRFGLTPRFGQHVESVRLVEGGWEVRTQDTLYQTKHVVVATGNTRQPNLPAWPGQDGFVGQILHSAHYRNAKPFVSQNVLVVGFGGLKSRQCRLSRRVSKAMLTCPTAILFA